MPGAAMFKIFISNLKKRTQATELRPLFEAYGTVVACDVVNNLGFVHMETEQQGRDAIRYLDGYVLNDNAIKVEAGRSRRPPITSTTKFFVGNLPENMRVSDIHELFGKYGTPVECGIVRNFGFVHLDCPGDVIKHVIKELNGRFVDGHLLTVEVSTSPVRLKPGMGNSDLCYRCGGRGHWAKDCLREYDGVRNIRAADYIKWLNVRDRYPPPPSPFLLDRIMDSQPWDHYRRFYGRRYKYSRMQDFLPSHIPRREAMPLPSSLRGSLSGSSCSRGYDLIFGRRSPPPRSSGISRYGNEVSRRDSLDDRMISSRQMRGPSLPGRRYAPY